MGIEKEILDDIRSQNFKIKIGDTDYFPSDLLKFRFTINETNVDFRFVKYDKYVYFLPFDDNNYSKYDIKIYDSSNLPIDVSTCVITISNGKSYSFKHFLVNIDLLNKELTKNPKFNPKLYDAKTDTQEYTISSFVSTPSDTTSSSTEKDEERLNRIEITQDGSTLSMEDIIWYISKKTNNRNYDEKAIDNFQLSLKTFDDNFLYENIFLNNGNYSSNAIAILLTMIPFFFTYPRFYNTSPTIIVVGVIGLFMCMNTIQSKFGVILKNKQLANIYIATVSLFYLFFFVLFNKINHLSLFFMSAGIIFMLMVYVLRIFISDPKRKYGLRRLVYNGENKIYDPYDQKIEKICNELIKRYSLNMAPNQLYMYFTTFETTEQSNKFMKTEFACNIVQPILCVLLLSVFGAVISKNKDYTLLKSREQLLQEANMKSNDSKIQFKQPEYEFLKSPLIGYTDLSTNILTNQYNYFLPKELNLYYIMESLMDEVNDKLLKEKKTHVYQKTILNEKITKNLNKYLKTFLEYIQSEYLPVCVLNSSDKDMSIYTTRKDNRYNLFDGTYNKVHDVLERYDMIEMDYSLIEEFYGKILDSKNSDKYLSNMIENTCKNFMYNNASKRKTMKEELNKKFYDVVYEKEIGKGEYQQMKSIMDKNVIYMGKIMEDKEDLTKELKTVEDQLKFIKEDDVTQRETLQIKYDGIKSKMDEKDKEFEKYSNENDKYRKLCDDIRKSYEEKIKSKEDVLEKAIEGLDIKFKENLFVTLIQKIEENNKVKDLDERNNALDNIKYKFKDIYDFITNEELFQQNEQTILINIIENKVQKLFKTLYGPTINYDKNNVILGNVTPNIVKDIGNKLFTYIVQPISCWILLGKLIGSSWWAGRMAMSDIGNNYEEIMRSFEYDGHFSSIWKICSMGIDNMNYERVMIEHRETIVNKLKNVNPVMKMIHYGLSFLFFLLFGVLLNAYNNSIFGMGMYPLWTNLPMLCVMLIILIIIYFIKK